MAKKEKKKKWRKGMRIVKGEHKPRKYKRKPGVGERKETVDGLEFERHFKHGDDK